MARVLIIKLSALGDIIIALPTIARLIRHHRKDTVSLVTRSSFAPLLTRLADWHKVEVIVLAQNRWLSVLQLAWVLRQYGFDRVYDLQGNRRSRALSYLSGAPHRLGLWNGWPYSQAVPITKHHRTHPQVRFEHLMAVSGIGSHHCDDGLPCWLEPGQTDIQRWLENRGLADKSFALCHAGGSQRWQTKRWPEDSFRILGQCLEEYDVTTIWIGGEEEKTINASLARYTGIDASGEFSIPELMSLAVRARFAITTDSAPMHALAVARIPVYSFFGPTDWKTSHAAYQRERVLTASTVCSPCYSPRCLLPDASHSCMVDITPAQVIARLLDDNLLAYRPVTVR